MSQTLEEFTEAYTKLLVGAWSDDSFAARLKSNPREVAAEMGLEIPPDVDVDVVEPEGDAKQALAEYHRDFEENIAAGSSVDIIIPAAPMVDLQDLNTEDLADVAGGAACCCCCPCCCCS